MPFSIPHRFRIVAFRRDLLSDYPTSSSNIEYILSGSERYIHIKAEALDQPVFYGARYRGLDTRYVAWQAMQRRASQGLQHFTKSRPAAITSSTTAANSQSLTAAEPTKTTHHARETESPEQEPQPPHGQHPDPDPRHHSRQLSQLGENLWAQTRSRRTYSCEAFAWATRKR